MGKHKSNGNIHPTRIFNEPADLEKVWDAYKSDLKEQANEWLKVQYVGKEGERVTDAQKVPMTFEGFKRYCRKSHGEVEQYFTNQDEYYKDFIGICRAIKEEIRENQIIGGLLGFYNPSITQRLNGLTEKVDTNNQSIVSGKVVIVSPNSTGVPLVNNEKDVNLDH